MPIVNTAISSVEQHHQVSIRQSQTPQARGARFIVKFDKPKGALLLTTQPAMPLLISVRRSIKVSERARRRGSPLNTIMDEGRWNLVASALEAHFAQRHSCRDFDIVRNE
jgi:hypothetical protein